MQCALGKSLSELGLSDESPSKWVFSLDKTNTIDSACTLGPAVASLVLDCDFARELLHRL